MIDFYVRYGINRVGQWHKLKPLRYTPRRIRLESEIVTTDHIHRMDLNYFDYVVRPNSPTIGMFVAVYGQGLNPIQIPSSHTSVATSKKFSPAITGNIGESILGILARTVLGAVGTDDFAPIYPENNSLYPDFLVRPRSPNAAIQINSGSLLHWPAESKAVSDTSYIASALTKAIQQISNYWYMTATARNSPAGYGFISCFYRGCTQSKNAPFVQLHILTPSDQRKLIDIIKHHRGRSDRKGFLKKMANERSEPRRCINND